MKEYWNKYTLLFGKTIFHPQFIIFAQNQDVYEEVRRRARNKTLIDIGCGNMPYRRDLEPVIKKYVGLEHPSFGLSYHPGEKPEILADISEGIPVGDNKFEIALFLEVLEYIENPIKVLKEINRILKRKGILIITCAFLYPIMKTPPDRNRFTDIQIRSMLRESGFKVLKVKELGGFTATILVFINIFLMKKIFDILKGKKGIISYLSLIFLASVTLPIVIFSNTIYILSRMIKIKSNNYFPIDYLVVASKL